MCWTPKHVSKAFRDGTRDSGSTYSKELPRGLFAGIIRDTWGFFFNYITAQHFFGKYKNQHEGALTKMNKNVISNAALCQLACSNSLAVVLPNLASFLKS
uniref:Uncharacterized protein n=1 Tax=Zea mays TaxID=4577 RepID=A0A804UG72_MAIZE